MSNGLRSVGALGTWLKIGSLLLLLSAGCHSTPAPVVQEKKIDYAAPLPEGQLALRKISPDQYPDFSAALGNQNPDDLRRALDHSLEYLARPGSERSYPYLDISHDRAVATVRAFRNLLDHPPNTDQWNAAIAQNFEVYQSIGAPEPHGHGYTGKVLFTGYFTPTYDASPTRGGSYQWPLYRRPVDLVTDATGERAGRRGADGSVTPYLTRMDIESGALAGQELIWLTSRWDAYVVTIQGSARLRLPDGQIQEVGFAGTNGYDYTSPGQAMIADGLIAKENMSFHTLKQYFDAHPEAMNKYLWLNRRTVFFTETSGGPYGSLNVPVTPLCSIATDKSVYPPAMVAFLSIHADGSEAPTTDAQARDAFVLDQDRGGAIRSAGRCDLYMGIGDEAEDVSGRQLSAGKLYYLAVKPELMGQ